MIAGLARFNVKLNKDMRRLKRMSLVSLMVVRQTMVATTQSNTLEKEKRKTTR